MQGERFVIEYNFILFVDLVVVYQWQVGLYDMGDDYLQVFFCLVLLIGRFVGYQKQFCVGFFQIFIDFVVLDVFVDWQIEMDVVEIDWIWQWFCFEYLFFVEDVVVWKIVFVVNGLDFIVIQQKNCIMDVIVFGLLGCV